jgi:hypothetical protein
VVGSDDEGSLYYESRARTWTSALLPIGDEDGTWWDFSDVPQTDLPRLVLRTVPLIALSSCLLKLLSFDFDARPFAVPGVFGHPG